MEKAEYIAYIEQRIDLVLKEYRFNNFKKQLAARKLSADFKRSYSEDFLWSRALYLSSNGSIILDIGTNDRLAIKSLREAAEIFENLSEVGEFLDKNYCLILSALCYDLAGYQANALCLMRQMEDYTLVSEQEIDLTVDNYIISQIAKILRKNIFGAKAAVNREFNRDIGAGLINKAFLKWFDFILTGRENDFLQDIDDSYRYYLECQNIYLSLLLSLLRSRIKISNDRSIWNNLFKIEHIRDNDVWTKYIKLLTNDIYSRGYIKDPAKRVSKFEFWTSQLRALQGGLLQKDESFVLQMPTSAGKTFVAELAILNALIKHPDRKCVYIAPFRALTNEKENELSDYLSKLGYSVSALSGSYEIDEFQQMILEDTNVLIATPEKIDLLLRLNPDYFNSIALLVVDEGHIVGEISPRASLLEFLIIRLRLQVPALQTLFISAVMPPANADEYSVWLNGTAESVIRSKLFNDSPPDEEWEPTRKIIGRFDWNANNGRVTYLNVDTENEETRASTNAFIPSLIRKGQYGNGIPKGDKKPQVCASLAVELARSGNCLIFCSQVRNTEHVGNALLAILDLIEEDENYPADIFLRNRERESYFFANKWYGSNSYVTKCLERGIGVHYGDMPEAVRRAVESDYAAGNLRILVATNTVGQGLNFPIKYVVIHSTIISASKDGIIKVSVRDFWNLIGRAGRAGMETEGQIIFVVSSYTDGQSYLEYTDKSNIEEAYSMFFNVLSAFLESRISESQYQEYMTTLSEPYLLTLLAEESVDNEDQRRIEEIINNSLFKIQADRREVNLEPIRRSFGRIIQSIKADVDSSLITVFSQTGFSVKSNNAIYILISQNISRLSEIVAEDLYVDLLEIIFTLFSENTIEEVKSEKLDKIRKTPLDILPIAIEWIEGHEILDLRQRWRVISDNPGHLHILISEGFYYRYAWGVSAFLTILRHALKLEENEIQIGIKNLPNYLKFGLNDGTACLARSLGIRNRDVSMLLSDKSNHLSGRAFIKWVSNLTNEDILDYDLNQYDSQNILSTALKLTPHKFEGLPNMIVFPIKGISFDVERETNSKTVKVGDKLEYLREPSNQFDPYAIVVLNNGAQLGYVPREYSKLMAIEIDVNQSAYQIDVIEVQLQERYNQLLVRMSKLL
jgi:replicative superfamily II helicase